MHGKKREEYKAKMRDPKTAVVLEKKAQQWYSLMDELNDRRKKFREQLKSMEEKTEEQEQKGGDVKDDDIEALASTMSTTLVLLDKCLLVNPDPLHLWNHRKELVLTARFLINDESNAINDTEINLVNRERNITQTALERNPKAYGPWCHRKWVLQTFRPPAELLQEELSLTAQFLQADERNFHCWNYRRFVVACLGNSWDGEWSIKVGKLYLDEEEEEYENDTVSLMGQQVAPNNSKNAEPATSESTPLLSMELLEAEFEFTTTKITQNFSNFSAFHYRGMLLERLDDACQENQNFLDILEERLDTEFQLIQDAVCTEPDDQTCWWYHAILLDKIVEYSKKGKNGNTSSSTDTLLERFKDRLLEQAELFQELLADEPDSKWVILGLFKVLDALNKEQSDDADEAEIKNSRRERNELLTKLQVMDPYRAKRYQELMSSDDKSSNESGGDGNGNKEENSNVKVYDYSNNVNLEDAVADMEQELDEENDVKEEEEENDTDQTSSVDIKNLAKSYLTGKKSKPQPKGCCGADQQKTNADGEVTSCACHSHEQQLPEDIPEGTQPSDFAKQLATAPAISCLVLGDAGVGKTSFLNLHMTGKFTEEHEATTSVGVAQLLFATNMGWMKCHTIDTCGAQHPLGGLDKDYFHAVQAVVIMYDVTDPKTYKNATKKWLREANSISPTIPKILVGNKCDLIAQRKVHKKDITFDKKPNQSYCDISVKIMGNVGDPFLGVIHKLTGMDNVQFVSSPEEMMIPNPNYKGDKDGGDKEDKS